MLRPDHTYLKVKDARAKGTRAGLAVKEGVLAEHLAQDNDFHSGEIEGALQIYENPYQKSVVEATLLAATLEETAEYTEIPLAVVEAYCAYFFDLKQLPTRLAKFEYVASLPEGVDKERKHVALTLGGEFLHFRLGKTIAMSPDEVLTYLLTDAYTMARQSMVTARLNAKSTRESYRWAALAVKIAESMARREGAQADDGLFSDLLIEPIYDASGDEMESHDLTANNIVRG